MAVPPAWRQPSCHTMAVTAVSAPEPATWTGTSASGTPDQYWTMPTAPCAAMSATSHQPHLRSAGSAFWAMRPKTRPTDKPR